MTIVLPSEGVSFRQAEQLLIDAQSQGLINPTSSNEQIIHVQLPLIEIHSEIDMTNPLIQFGMGNMYLNTDYFLKYESKSTQLITRIIQNTTISVKSFSGVINGISSSHY